MPKTDQIFTLMFGNITNGALALLPMTMEQIHRAIVWVLRQKTCTNQVKKKTCVPSTDLTKNAENEAQLATVLRFYFFSGSGPMCFKCLRFDLKVIFKLD